MEFNTIIYDCQDKLAKIIFNRPEVHNAFNRKRRFRGLPGRVKGVRGE